ncbi:hypothetical protein [Streptomyces sp. NBC_00443]|uniref:hypothetical protein n=1 Tax=Streptomyces sp. NBC_00443 TaxID=2975743 RepID=UPI002E23DB00
MKTRHPGQRLYGFRPRWDIADSAPDIAAPPAARWWNWRRRRTTRSPPHCRASSWDRSRRPGGPYGIWDGGSVTLTAGTFPVPLPGGSLGALISTGLEGFVRNAAAELPRDLRINAISPGWVKETLDRLGMDPADGIPVADVAREYVDAVEDAAQGQTIRLP